MLEAGAEAGGQLHHDPLRARQLRRLGAGRRSRARRAARGAARGLRRGGPLRRARRPRSSPRPPAVRDASGERLEARAVLIATGVRRRRLEVPGERELEGRGVSYSATQDRDALRRRGRGGGRAAATRRSRTRCCSPTWAAAVTLVGAGDAARAARPSASGSRGRPPHRGARGHAGGGDRGRGAGRRGAARGRATARWELPVAGVVIKAGVDPQHRVVPRRGRARRRGLDPRWTTATARRTRAVWAAGDVTRPEPLGLSVAAGQGALAVAALRAALLDG